MKFKITKEHKSAIEDYKQSLSEELEARRLYLQKMANKFSVGDILVRYNYDLLEKTIESDLYPIIEVARRFLVVDVDALSGEAYVMPINENADIEGGDVSSTWPEDVLFGAIQIYELDPLYVDSVLLGAPYGLFDIISNRKSLVDQYIKDRKRDSKVFYSLRALNSFLKSLPKNSKIYFHDDNEQSFMKPTFQDTSINITSKRSVMYFSQTQRGSYEYDAISRTARRSKSKIKFDDQVLYFSKTCKFRTSISLLGKAIYVNPPISLDKIINAV